MGSQLLSCMSWNWRRHKTTYWADYFSFTNLSEWSWPKMWMYRRISSLWSFLAYWKMIICKENYSRILVYWEGRVKTTSVITSALTAKENCSCEVHSQGRIFGVFPLSVGTVCLCACVYTHVSACGGGNKVADLLVTWDSFFHSTSLYMPLQYFAWTLNSIV